MRNSQCEHCRHMENSKEGHVCAAFPKGIPTAVYTNKIRHNTPIVGQVGKIVFEPKEQYLERKRAA